VRRHRRHGLRAAAVLASAAAAWWYLDGPVPSAAGLAAADWPGLGWAVLAAACAAEALRAVTFFTGPAWWVALATDRARAGWRHRRAHHLRAWWEHGWATRGDGRPSIPAGLHRAVFWADRFTCMACGLTQAAGAVLHWDHRKPWDRGGLTSPWNGGTLCSRCNIVKCDVWVYPRRTGPGALYYSGHGDPDEALGILAAVTAARRGPVRLARLALACLLG
jgi:hypothetical protein